MSDGHLVELAGSWARNYLLAGYRDVSFYNIRGHLCAFTCNDPTIAWVARAGLAHYLLAAIPARAPEGTVTVVCVDTPDNLPRFLLRAGKDWAADGIGIIDPFEGRSVYVYGYAKKRCVVFFLRDSVIMHRAACTAHGILGSGLFADVLPIFHCAGIARDAGAVAFLGDSGSGKSTLAYIASRFGYRMLSDDSCFVSFEGGRPALSSFVREIHVRPGASPSAGVPASVLADYPLGYDPSGTYPSSDPPSHWKHRIPVSCVESCTDSSPCRLAAIVFPRVTVPDPSRIRGISPGEAYSRMAAIGPMFSHFSWRQLPPSHYESYLAAAKRLSHAVPAFEALSGTAPARIVEALDKLVGNY